MRYDLKDAFDRVRGGQDIDAESVVMLVKGYTGYAFDLEEAEGMIRNYGNRESR